MKDFEKHLAFTLPEMMVVMLIMSIIMAAMAPVMTTRMQAQKANEQTSPWHWAENKIDAYFNGRGTNQNNARAMIGQTKGTDAEDARLIINASDARPNHILFKKGNDILGKLVLSGKGLQLGTLTDGTALGNGSVAIGNNTEAPEGGSTVVGQNAKATGGEATAIGVNARATGFGSLALGRRAVDSDNKYADYGATADYSMALGNTAKATALRSTAIGYTSVSSGTDSVAIGTNSSTNKAGTIAIGYNATTTKDDSTNEYSIAIGGSANATGQEAIAMGMAAESPDNGNIAIGSRARAIGKGAINIGIRYSASEYTDYGANGTNSIAIGTLTKTNSANSIAIGNEASAQGSNSIAIGAGTSTIGAHNIAIGTEILSGNNPDRSDNIAIGRNACANVTGSNKICIGANSGPAKTLDSGIGRIGDNPDQDDVERIFIGSKPKSFNSATSGNIYDDKFGTNAVVEIVNTKGENFVKRNKDSGTKRKVYSDGPTVYINANMVVRGYIWSIIPDDKGDDDEAMGLFSVDKAADDNDSGLEARLKDFSIPIVSDRRLKYVGTESKSGLDKIRQLKIFNYTFKKDEKKTPHVGVMAQDLQKIFPDAVTKGDDGFLRIRMEDMFYAVINAIKELDATVKRHTEALAEVTQLKEILKQVQNDNKQLKAENKKLREDNKRFEARLKALEAKVK